MSEARFNIATYLPRMARESPDQSALAWPVGPRRYDQMTFSELDAMCDRFAHTLERYGVRRGDRVLMMVRQGPELIAVTFALFKLGAVPVLIDPGMGRESFLACVRDARPRCMVGIPLALLARRVFRSAFASVELAVCTEKKWWAFAPPLAIDAPQTPFTPAPTTRDDLAAILFTSGSTGPPKGVLYTHGIFDGQVQAIRQMYDIQPGESAVPAFPLFALFSVAMGMQCVIPDMDPACPAKCNPANLVYAIDHFQADMAFGSPAIWTIVVRHCEETNTELPSLTRMLMFGAAIPPKLMERWEHVMPNGRVHTPYGATESLPVASISSAEVLGETAALSRQGKGICVGRPVDAVEVRIIRITDAAIPAWSEDLRLPDGDVGEICVRGPMVTRGYDNKPGHDVASKIADADTSWHRMGDLGYFDEHGRLWFCGRKAHRVETARGTMFTVPCEAVFNEHPDVYRSALIALGQAPAIIIEPEPGKFPTNAAAERAFEASVLKLGQSSELTAAIDAVFFDRAFPVDRRHNAKIHREELAQKYARRLR